MDKLRLYFPSGDPIVFGGGIFSTEYSYDIKYTIQDAFNTVSVIDLISTAAVVMDFKSGGKGVAIGKVSKPIIYSRCRIDGM